MAQTYLNVKGSTPWAILLVQFPDVLVNPQDFHRNYFERLFMNVAGSSGGVYEYWKRTSYGAIDLDGTAVFGPITLMKVSAEYGSANELWSDALALWWAQDPAEGSDPMELDGFDRIIFITNLDTPSLNTGALYRALLPWSGMTRRADLACALLEPGHWHPTSAAHEMGHAYGLDHSFDEGPATCGSTPPWNQPGEYCDRFDIMSASNVVTRQGPLGPIGPILSAPYLLKMAWLPDARIQWVANGLPPARRTITLDALENPGGTGNAIAALRYPDGAGGEDIYTVEFRDEIGANPAIVVHRWDASDRSVLLAHDGRNKFEYRQFYVDALDRFQAGLKSVEGRTAEVEIGPVRPHAELRVTTHLRRETMVDEDAFEYPPPGTRPLRDLCGSGVFPYRAFEQDQEIVAWLIPFWFDSDDELTVRWTIDGQALPSLTPAGNASSPTHMFSTRCRKALPAPHGTGPSPAVVVLGVQYFGGHEVSLKNRPADGNFSFHLHGTITSASGKTASAGADVTFTGQRVDIFGGWDQYVVGCKVARLVWLGGFRQRAPRWPSPRPAPDAPHLPPNPGDPPPLPRDVHDTLETLAWCAMHSPDDLDHAVVGALKLHGLAFADTLRLEPWAQALNWGRPRGRGLLRDSG